MKLKLKQAKQRARERAYAKSLGFKGTWSQGLAKYGYIKVRKGTHGGCTECVFGQDARSGCTQREHTPTVIRVHGLGCTAEENNGVFGLYYIRVPNTRSPRKLKE